MKDTEYLEDILSQLRITMIRKHQDYGPYNIANAPGGAMNGLIVRMHDKMTRLENLHYNQKQHAELRTYRRYPVRFGKLCHNRINGTKRFLGRRRCRRSS